jgi:hypothetical protein
MSMQFNTHFVMSVEQKSIITYYKAIVEEYFVTRSENTTLEYLFPVLP